MPRCAPGCGGIGGQPTSANALEWEFSLSDIEIIYIIIIIIIHDKIKVTGRIEFYPKKPAARPQPRHFWQFHCPQKCPVRYQYLIG